MEVSKEGANAKTGWCLALLKLLRLTGKKKHSANAMSVPPLLLPPSQLVSLPRLESFKTNCQRRAIVLLLVLACRLFRLFLGLRRS